VGIPNPATINGVTIGNGLKAETANGYDIGLDISLSPSALFRATYYRIDIANGLEGRVFAGIVDDNTDTVCPGSYYTCASYYDGGTYSYLYQRRNSSASVSTGWEFSFEWKIDDQWKLDLTHSIFDTRGVGGVNNNDDQGQFFYGYQRAGVPFYTSAFAVSYDTPSFGATLSGSLVGSKPLSNFQPPDLVRPSYFVSDITFRVPVNAAITLNGGLFNIFNAQYEGNSRGVVSPGTNFRVGVSATF
jgi:outer membrane receptor protein involved in Fe transport